MAHIMKGSNTMKQKAAGLKYSANIDQANLWQFKNVIAKGEVRFLLKLSDYVDEWPECDLEELSNAWFNIYSQFSEIAGGNSADLWLVKRRRLVSMKLNHQLGSVVLRAVQVHPVKETIKIANECGYFIDPDNLEATFEKAYTKLKRLENKILTIENDSKEETKTDDLEGLIATLEKHQGYQFDEREMSVRKFANIYKNYKDARQQDR
jgi:hypothetical protein